MTVFAALFVPAISTRPVEPIIPQRAASYKLNVGLRVQEFRRPNQSNETEIWITARFFSNLFTVFSRKPVLRNVLSNTAESFLNSKLEPPHKTRQDFNLFTENYLHQPMTAGNICKYIKKNHSTPALIWKPVYTSILIYTVLFTFSVFLKNSCTYYFRGTLFYHHCTQNVLRDSSRGSARSSSSTPWIGVHYHSVACTPICINVLHNVFKQDGGNSLISNTLNLTNMLFMIYRMHFVTNRAEGNWLWILVTQNGVHQL